MEREVLMQFLRKIDAYFCPLLSQKTDVESFCDRLLTHAQLFASFDDNGGIKGLVAIYANDFENRYAYIPLLAVDKAFRRQGIAQNLMRQVLRYVRGLGTDKIARVGIHTSNPVAQHLYEELGFCLKDETATREYLEMEL